MKDAVADLGLPQILLETSQRSQGLVLLTGQRESGLESTVEALIGEGRRAHRLDERPVPPTADVVIADGEVTVASVHRLLVLSEEGRLVLWLMRTTSPLAGLRRILSLEFGEGRRHVLWRLMDQLSLISGQMRLKSMAGASGETAREIILMTPPMRAALETEDLAAAEDLIKAGEETSGTVSFNQSLLQLLLRRRIDIKTAFESTRDPIHLDQILKKVGI